MKVNIFGVNELQFEGENAAEKILLFNLHKALCETRDARESVFRKAVASFRPGMLGRLYNRIFNPNRSALWEEWNSVGSRVSSARFHNGTVVLSIKLMVDSSAQTER